MPNGKPSDPFPYNYSPWLDFIYYNLGTGQIAGTKANPVFTCYTWKGSKNGTPSPTAFYTPAPTNAISDFTYIGQGWCLDSSNEYYSDQSSPIILYVNKQTAETTCSNYCGQ